MGPGEAGARSGGRGGFKIVGDRGLGVAESFGWGTGARPKRKVDWADFRWWLGRLESVNTGFLHRKNPLPPKGPCIELWVTHSVEESPKRPNAGPTQKTRLPAFAVGWHGWLKREGLVKGSVSGRSLLEFHFVGFGFSEVAGRLNESAGRFGGFGENVNGFRCLPL